MDTTVTCYRISASASGVTVTTASRAVPAAGVHGQEGLKGARITSVDTNLLYSLSTQIPPLSLNTQIPPAHCRISHLGDVRSALGRVLDFLGFLEFSAPRVTEHEQITHHAMESALPLHPHSVEEVFKLKQQPAIQQ